MSAVLEASNEPKIVLLVRLLNAIDEGNHSFEGLKERIAEGGHRPSTRSLRRYLAILSEAGFPWHFDRSTNAYRFAGGYSLKRLDLSNGELFGLVALRSLGASIGGTIGSSIDEVTERLVGTAGRSVKARVDRPSPVAFRLAEIALDENGERAFALLSSAERSSRSVQFAYRDKEGTATTRSADPYGFVVNGGRIYCIAFDHARKDKRTFAVDSMTDVTVLAPHLHQTRRLQRRRIRRRLDQRRPNQHRIHRSSRKIRRESRKSRRSRPHRRRPPSNPRTRRLHRNSLPRQPTSTNSSDGSSAGAPKPKSCAPPQLETVLRRSPKT